MRSNNLLPGTSHATSTHRPPRASQFGLEGDGTGSGEENENDALISSTRKRSSTKTSTHKSFVPFTKDTENPYEHDTSEIDSLHHGDSSQKQENTLLQMRSNFLLPGTSHTTNTRHRPHRASQFGLDYYHASSKGTSEGGGSGEEKENDSLIGTRKRSSTRTSAHKSFVPFTKDTEDPFEHDTSEHDSLPSHHHNSPPPVIVNPTTWIRYTIDEILSFSYSISGTGAISSLILLFYYGLFTGGPAVLVWGFLIAAFFSAIVVANIAEICSAYPRNAGSVYYWTGQLAPKVILNHHHHPRTTVTVPSHHYILSLSFHSSYHPFTLHFQSFLILSFYLLSGIFSYHFLLDRHLCIIRLHCLCQFLCLRICNSVQ